VNDHATEEGDDENHPSESDDFDPDEDFDENAHFADDEDDVRWSLVALKYPAPFKALTDVDPRDPEKSAYELALQCARHWYPDIVARYLQKEKPAHEAGESADAADSSRKP
jgi:hypothetical protein